MKTQKLFPVILIILVMGFLPAAIGQNVIAVNDTIDLTPGFPAVFNLFANDTIPPGDSVEVMSLNTGNALIQKTFIFGGIYSFLLDYWGIVPYSTGSYTIRDFTQGTISNAGIYFRIRDNSYDTLDINNVSAVFNASGNQFQYPLFLGDYKYIVPKNSGRSTIFNNTLWIGGTDEEGIMHLAAERYRQGPVNGQAGLAPDYYAGPVMDSVNYGPVMDTLWNRIWNVRRSDIEYHIAHWNDPGYVPIQDILTWPGNGLTLLGQAPQLAPFHDRNGDGIYDPYDGDYPWIRGDQALFFIFNDDRGLHKETLGNKLKVEIHGMAYAFDMPSDSAFKNTVFLNYKIYNRSEHTYTDTYISAFTDLDIGFWQDDYVGCDVERSSYFAYNGDPVDGDGTPPSYGENPPAQAVTILAGPYLEPDNIDNPSHDNSGNQLCNESVNGTGFGDGIVDNERMGLRKFNFTFNSLAGVPDYFLDPNYAPQYYLMMKGFWRDSTSFTYGGEGHPDAGAYGPECSFMFPGDSDTLNWGVGCNLPNGPVYWTERTAANVPSDRRGVGSMGPFTFNPGDVQEVDIAFVFARDYTGSDSLKSITKLREMIDIIRGSFASSILPDGRNFLGIDEMQITQQDFTIFPNPARDRLTIRFTQGNYSFRNIVITDLQGRVVKPVSISPGSSEYSVDVSKLPEGFYFLSISGYNGNSTRKVAVIH